MQASKHAKDQRGNSRDSQDVSRHFRDRLCNRYRIAIVGLRRGQCDTKIERGPSLQKQKGHKSRSRRQYHAELCKYAGIKEQESHKSRGRRQYHAELPGN
jgi:hypothetical protein